MRCAFQSGDEVRFTCSDSQRSGLRPPSDAPAAAGAAWRGLGNVAANWRAAVGRDVSNAEGAGRTGWRVCAPRACWTRAAAHQGQPRLWELLRRQPSEVSARKPGQQSQHHEPARRCKGLRRTRACPASWRGARASLRAAPSACAASSSRAATRSAGLRAAVAEPGDGAWRGGGGSEAALGAHPGGLAEAAAPSRMPPVRHIAACCATKAAHLVSNARRVSRCAPT